MDNRNFFRKQVWWVNVPDVGRKPFVVVSNNARNRKLNDVLAARITTAQKPNGPTIVEIPNKAGLTGRVLCDDISAIPKNLMLEFTGVLDENTMELVDVGLKEALALNR